MLPINTAINMELFEAENTPFIYFSSLIVLLFLWISRASKGDCNKCIDIRLIVGIGR